MIRMNNQPFSSNEQILLNLNVTDQAIPFFPGNVSIILLTAIMLSSIMITMSFFGMFH